MNARARLGFVARIVSFVAVLTLATSASAQSDPPADLAGARRIVTPAGRTAWEYNNCLVTMLQGGDSPSTDVVSDFCGSGGGRGSIGFAYQWLPDFLAEALRSAERAVCGTDRCALGNRAVRIYVTWGQEPTIRTERTDRIVTIYMTSVVVDLVQTATTHFLREVGGSATPFTDWLALVDRRSRGTCDSIETGDRTIRSDEAFRFVLGAAQMFYTFLLAHELSHLHGTAGCPEQGQTLQEETACDEAAVSSLMTTGAFLPPVVIATLTAMAHYQNVLDPVLDAPGGEGHAYSEVYPAARWIPRANSILTRWNRFCEAGNTQGVVCRPGWRPGVAAMRTLLARPLPAACDPRVARRASSTTLTSRNCLYFAGPRAGQSELTRDQQPYAVGSPCTDRAGSEGFYVPEDAVASTLYPPALSATCAFESGPRAGRVQWFPGAAPRPVGYQCDDGRGSAGRIVVGVTHHAAELSRACRMNAGPLSGSTQQLPVPLAVGSMCGDGMASEGIIVADNTDTATTISQSCRFTYGPRSGATQWFPESVPVPVGMPCRDGFGSFGVAAPDEPHTTVELSRTCRFQFGPRSGQTMFFPQGTPTVIGGTCNDGAGSIGSAVRDSASSAPR